MPESTEENLPDRRRDDTRRIEDIILNGVGVEGVKISKLVRLGGRGQNQQDKPRLVMATLEQPDRRRAVLASACLLRHTDDWRRIYISPDLTPAERANEKSLRDELRARREAGEKNIIRRGQQLVTVPGRVDRELRVEGAEAAALQVDQQPTEAAAAAAGPQ